MERVLAVGSHSAEGGGGCCCLYMIDKHTKDQMIICSSILIFVVFIPIWTSWLWLDRIMILRFVPSLKSLIAAISH